MSTARMRLTILLSAASLLASLAFAQYPAPVTDSTVIKSNRFPGLSVSYKSTSICEETPGVAAYSGYVHIPPNTLDVKQDYPINSFFWFFEAHENPEEAPLTVWMNGGPGATSLHGLFEEVGPCDVANDSQTTVPREWAWNKLSNMIFLDQPVQVGFSYDTLHNGTLSFSAQNQSFEHKLVDFDTNDIPENNSTFFLGTFPSLDPKNTANTTSIAAETFWYFMQVWTEAFPQYIESNEFSIFAQSYGGHYGPRFSAFLEKKSDSIAASRTNGVAEEYTEGPVELHISSLGIVSGCIEYVTQYAGAFELGINNTYQIPFLNASTAAFLSSQYLRPNGCKSHYLTCQNLFPQDPYGDSSLVSSCISKANAGICNIVHDQPPYTEFEYVRKLGRNRYDFTHNATDPFPWTFWQGYVMDAGVQRELGVPVNFSTSAQAVARGFSTIQDRFSTGYADDIGFLLERGVKVALIYGDRDFACNWIGGEMTSLSINYTQTQKFAAAGYAKLYTNQNQSEVGGEVRQYGNLSFSRVYQAGHAIPAYAPETSFRIFERTLKGLDISTGLQKVTPNYTTTGPSKSTTKTTYQGPGEAPICYLLDPVGCTKEQFEALAAGDAVVENYLVIEPAGGSSSGGTSKKRRETEWEVGVIAEKF